MNHSRRSLLKLGGAGLATLATTKNIGYATPVSWNIDLILSITVEQAGQFQDLGGVRIEDYPVDALGSATCCSAVQTVNNENTVSLHWQNETPLSVAPDGG